LSGRFTPNSISGSGDAYREIEPLIRDVDRMAHIAGDLAIKVGGTGKDIELAQFATVQLEKMAKHLLTEYERLWEEARAT
jgi:hypothetical protein